MALGAKERGALSDAPRSSLLNVVGGTSSDRRDHSRPGPSRRCLGWTPLDGAQLRSSGRTPPGSQEICQSSSDHLLSLVAPIEAEREVGLRTRPYGVVCVSVVSVPVPVSSSVLTRDSRSSIRPSSRSSL